LPEEPYLRLLDLAAEAGMLEGVCQGFEDADAGRVKPACEVFEEVRAVRDTTLKGRTSDSDSHANGEKRPRCERSG
jgi:hypothetical protein